MPVLNATAPLPAFFAELLCYYHVDLIRITCLAFPGLPPEPILRALRGLGADSVPLLAFVCTSPGMVAHLDQGLADALRASPAPLPRFEGGHSCGTVLTRMARDLYHLRQAAASQ
jgi:hypothetical protein